MCVWGGGGGRESEREEGCHNLLTINPKEHTPNPEIIMENTVTVPYGSRRLKKS